ncbi:BZIP domain-containing protein [Caenorhabditis elegans]|uniref:BZIP domain-containing protein n=1 Tax=Caenorhabditis elegans TaxID=6239 RepID=Q18132_CAEEL|nr:BZIP domain-containing protein [Caenorhabditis elegans]CCD65555.1 BZIP domain-containing protein [Caenorhabditis elegans]|eukprot:NP_508860.1 Uncharacterized protein CELE_C24H10.4 [Caenorhabditis elegans]
MGHISKSAAAKNASAKRARNGQVAKREAKKKYEELKTCIEFEGLTDGQIKKKLERIAKLSGKKMEWS